MKKELDDRLCKDFPRLYSDRNGNPMSTNMCWGFECGDGWYDLIRNLSEKLEAEIESLPIPEIEKYNYRASQVKEKYGQLRYYMVSSTNIMDELIEQAEDESVKICMECGKSGKIRGKSWLYCSCNDCAKPQDRI